jgi:AcrR family transcriptional regulator
MEFTARGQVTRQRIIDGTSAYLRSEGSSEVTLDDIRDITATSKGQIYHYFPGGKEELLLTVARFQADLVLADQQPELSNLTTWASWNRWRDKIIGRYQAQRQHCPLGVLMSQVGSTPGAEEVMSDLLTTWEAHIRRGIEHTQATGKIRNGLDPGRAAAAFIAGIQGGVQVLRSTGRNDHLVAVLDALIEYLRQP